MAIGRSVTQTSLDTVRIEVLGEGRAKNIPASLIVDLDDLLRAMIENDTEELIIAYDFEEKIWTADWGHYFGRGATPWGCLVNLWNRYQAKTPGIEGLNV